MSRCFPYPPPGYTPSRASNEALIESIKLQKEREKAKAERKKEKKREKKEKKKAKEENAKQIKAGQLDHDVYHGESPGHGKGEIPQKERKEDTEQLERSSITEEHEQPISSQNPSYSSDSTQNSGKRKRHPSPVKGTRVQGNILRIRLPSQKHIKYDIKVSEEQPIRLPSQKLIKRDIGEGEELLVGLPSHNHGELEIRGSKEQLCSTSGRTDVLAEPHNSVRRADDDKSYPTSLATEVLVNDQKLTQPNSVERHDDPCMEYLHTDSNSKRYRKLKKVADRYRDLTENWTPPSMLRETRDGEEEEDWLLGKKNEVSRPEKKLRGSTGMTCSSSSTLWPRAHYLPDADVYALPFAIPF